MEYKDLPNYCARHICPDLTKRPEWRCQYPGTCKEFKEKYKTQFNPAFSEKHGLLPEGWDK